MLGPAHPTHGRAPRPYTVAPLYPGAVQLAPNQTLAQYGQAQHAAALQARMASGNAVVRAHARYGMRQLQRARAQRAKRLA